MALKRATIFVSGNVQRVGYRDKVINAGRHLNLRGYVENKPDGRVQIVAEGEEDNLNKFLDAVNIKNVLINVEHIDHSFMDAAGDFSGFNKLVRGGETDERLDTAAHLLKQLIEVTQNGFSETISAIKSVKEDTSTMLDKQDQMLDKQDTTIEVLKSVKEDTSQINQDTASMPAIKEDAREIKHSTSEMVSGLWNKYEELHREIAEIKATLSASHLM